MENASVVQTRVINPPTRWPRPDLRELWEHRDLVVYLAKRDLAIRYRQSIIGVSWAVLQPVLLAGVFSLFLGLLQKVPSEAGIPYPLFAVSGVVMWLFFSTSIDRAAVSTAESSGLISKIYFPRLAIPLAAVLPALVDFAVAFVVLVIIAIGYGHPPGIEILALPLVVALAFVCTMGIGLWTSSLNAKYRDVQQAVTFALLLGLFIAPILYPLSQVPASLQIPYSLNPTVGVLEAFRWMLLGVSPSLPSIGLSVAIGSALVATGLVYFRRAEQSFADII